MLVQFDTMLGVVTECYNACPSTIIAYSESSSQRFQEVFFLSVVISQAARRVQYETDVYFSFTCWFRGQVCCKIKSVKIIYTLLPPISTYKNLLPLSYFLNKKKRKIQLKTPAPTPPNQIPSSQITQNQIKSNQISNKTKPICNFKLS